MSEGTGGECQALIERRSGGLTTKEIKTNYLPYAYTRLTTDYCYNHVMFGSPYHLLNVDKFCILSKDTNPPLITPPSIR